MRVVSAVSATLFREYENEAPTFARGGWLDVGCWGHALTNEHTFADEWTRQIWLWIKIPSLA